MKKMLLSVGFVAALLSAGTLSAQKFNIGINGAGALPLGDFADDGQVQSSAFGFGGDLTLDYYFNDRFDLGIEVGYKSFPYANDTLTGIDGEAIQMIPIQLTGGIHMDIDDWIDLYGELGAGLFITSYRDVDDDTFAFEDESDSYFGLSPRVGLAFELTPVLFLDVNVNYTYLFSGENSGIDPLLDIPNYNWLGANVGLLYTIREF